ncbi:flippase [candidate division KSB1 bacterium]|nr:flippase [candidate division KSB1 bacterium]
MEPVVIKNLKPKKTKPEDATRKQLRGSSLLLTGRMLSVGINFAAQVLLVRHLSTTDFGAWAYALSVVSFCQGFAVLGLDRAITRFIPIYHENEEYGKLFGTILLVFGTVLFTSLLIIGAFFAAPDLLAKLMAEGTEQSFTLLYILIFLMPVEALDGLMVGLFASFANPKAIFFRKHVLGPLLKFTVVLLLILFKSDAVFLAYGYLASSILGVLIYVWLFVRLLYREGMMARLRAGELSVPFREIFSFTIPMMTSDLVSIVIHSADALLLGYFHGPAEVAFYRVVLPAAKLNSIVMTSFSMLFTPTASRLFAKQDFAGINELYWRTAVWLAVLSFPVFVLTFSIADPLTVFLYGERYARSGLILALLSLGYYFSAALGFNGLTLKVIGKLRFIVNINIAAAVANVLLNLLLIPKFGALGAGIGTASTMIIHNIFKQAGLRYASGLRLFDKKYFSFYALIAGSAIGLFVFQEIFAVPIYVAVALCVLVSLGVLWVSKSKLNVKENFPELLKLPLVGKLLR